MTFNGFGIPKENWSKLPHCFIEALPLIETLAEMKVVLYVLRHTWGYQDDEKRISIDEFVNGRKHSARYRKRHPEAGERIDNGTGMSANSVKDGIKRAVRHGFIQVDSDDNDKARIRRYYSLNSGGQKLTPWGSEVDPLPSEVDPRTKKETLERNSERNFPPSSGENPPQKEPESFEDLFPQPEPTPRRTAEQAVEQLQAVTGTDPLSGALKAIETASAKSPTVPAVAGGADPWEKVALAFCGLHGLTLVDVRESDRKNWPRKLESIAETARATPAQMIKAIMVLPESEYHFKSYSSPYMRSFEPDIIMLVSQMATGQDVRAKGNGHAKRSGNNGAQPTSPGSDDAETISRKLAAAIADRS